VLRLYKIKKQAKIVKYREVFCRKKDKYSAKTAKFFMFSAGGDVSLLTEVVALL
jgi:hypothetical protein